MSIQTTTFEARHYSRANVGHSAELWVRAASTLDVQHHVREAEAVSKLMTILP